MAIAETEKEEIPQDGPVVTETGVAYPGKGEGEAEARQIGGTDPAASLSDNALTAARQKAEHTIRSLEQKVAEIKAHAAARGDEPPEIDTAALSQDPTGLSGKDLELLQQQLSKVEEKVNHEQGKQMQQSVGEAIGMAAALGAIGGSGALAALLMGGAKNVNEGALFTPEINHGLGARGQEQQKERDAALLGL